MVDQGSFIFWIAPEVKVGRCGSALRDIDRLAGDWPPLPAAGPLSPPLPCVPSSPKPATLGSLKLSEAISTQPRLLWKSTRHQFSCVPHQMTSTWLPIASFLAMS